MIIYDNVSDEKIYIELSELGICTDFVCSLEFTQYEKDSNAFALYFEFINYDKVKRFIDDSIALHILSSGFIYSYNQFEIGISFVYYFNTNTTKINVDITSFDEAEETEKYFNVDLTKARLMKMTEGLCVQIMHKGTYDDEPASIEKMKAFIADNGYSEDFFAGRMHHEIYLSDPRRCAPEKLKTVIRHPIK